MYIQKQLDEHNQQQQTEHKIMVDKQVVEIQEKYHFL